MKVVALISGGKDSCYAMMRCLDYGHEIVALANLHPVDESVDELDSFMYQTVGHQIVMAYAKCMGLPLFRRQIRGISRAQGLRYMQTFGDEVEDLFLLLKEVQKHFPTIGAVSSGAIASDYQRMRVENVCSRLGLVSLAFLWKQEQDDLLQKMISSGIQAVLVKVAAMGLKPHAHLGKTLAEMQPQLIHLNSLYGINVCGEGGEYETLTLDCPLFKNFRIVLDAFEIVLHSPDNIAPVGVLHPSQFHLENKHLGQSIEDVGQIHHVHEVEVNSEELLQSESDTYYSHFPLKDYENFKLECCSASRRNGDFVTVSCQRGSYTDAYGIEQELGFMLASINDELRKEEIGWGNVMYIHLYINDMSAFPLINQTYMKIITEEQCARGVPSRSTVGLGLFDSGMGRVIVEVIAAKNLDKRVLHVQSISCWAPSCIGPYSQATLQHGMLFMAGQLGLDPPTMDLVSGGAGSQTKQAVHNCQAVVEAFSTSLVHSLISLIIYCSSSLDLVERQEAEVVLVKSLAQGNDDMQNLPILFVHVPALPKGAAVEVEPFVYVPVNDDGSDDEGNANGKLSIKIMLPNKACRATIVSGHLCRAFFSVKKTDHVNYNDHDESLARIHNELKLCLETFSELLSEASLDWENALALRVMFVAERISYRSIFEDWKHAVDDFLSSPYALSCNAVRSSAFSSLQPLFLPVVGLGKDADLNDLLSLDLLAAR